MVFLMLSFLLNFGRGCLALLFAARYLPGAAAAALLAQASVGLAAENLVPVLAIKPALQEYIPDLALTGTIRARIQSNIAFRVAGKISARHVEVGQHVNANDVLASLDPTEEQADLASAQAALSAAEALEWQAETTFRRQQNLLATGFTTRAAFDKAVEDLNTTRAEVEAKRSALSTAEEKLSFTELKAGHDGVIVARDVETGQVVQAGQTVFVLAQDGPRDAVFDVPEVMLTEPPKDKGVDLFLQSNPKIRASGSVREISPVVNTASDTVTFKFAVNESGPQLPLGAAVIGRGHWAQDQVFILPWSAIFEMEGQPAVWLLDDQDRVFLQAVEVRSYATGAVAIAAGLDGSHRVVVAGIQLLHPGQKVAVREGNRQ